MSKANILMGLTLLVALTACESNKEDNYDELGIYPVVSGAAIVYADQTVDSFTVVSTNSWKASTDNEWLWLDELGMSREINSSRIIYTQCPIKFQPNTSGSARFSLLKVTSGSHNVARPYLQTYWPNIQYPVPTFEETRRGGAVDVTDMQTFRGVEFSETIARDTTSARIVLTLYANNATLKTDAAWIAPQEITIEQGRHDIALTCTENVSGAERKAVYTLTTSNGVTAAINITQQK